MVFVSELQKLGFKMVLGGFSLFSLLSPPYLPPCVGNVLDIVFMKL